MENATVEFSIPESLKKITKDISQIIEEKQSTTVYEYRFKIPKEYFKENNLTDLSFELKADEIYKANRKTIYKSFIPLNISELSVD